MTVTLYCTVTRPPFLLISSAFPPLLFFFSQPHLAFSLRFLRIISSASPLFFTMASLTDFVDFSQSSLKGMSDIIPNELNSM